MILNFEGKLLLWPKWGKLVIFGQKINIFEFGFFSKIIPLKRGSRLGIKIDGFVSLRRIHVILRLDGNGSFQGPKSRFYTNLFIRFFWIVPGDRYLKVVNSYH